MADILVADDDPAIVDALRMMLEDEGFGVHTTLNAQDVAGLAAAGPDLILLDIWMSGHNGGDVCRNLKDDVSTGDIPVVLMSANYDIKSIAHYAGADDYIFKPFNIDDMLIKIRRCLS